MLLSHLKILSEVLISAPISISHKPWMMIFKLLEEISHFLFETGSITMRNIPFIGKAIILFEISCS